MLIFSSKIYHSHLRFEAYHEPKKYNFYRNAFLCCTQLQTVHLDYRCTLLGVTWVHPCPTMGCTVFHILPCLKDWSWVFEILYPIFILLSFVIGTEVHEIYFETFQHYFPEVRTTTCVYLKWNMNKPDQSNASDFWLKNLSKF